MATGITRILVSPDRPTALEGQKEMPLPGQDLWTNYVRIPVRASTGKAFDDNALQVRNVHVVPGTIDLPRFKAALSKILARYPTVAGRVFRVEDDWKVCTHF